MRSAHGEAATAARRAPSCTRQPSVAASIPRHGTRERARGEAAPAGVVQLARATVATASATAPRTWGARSRPRGEPPPGDVPATASLSESGVSARLPHLAGRWENIGLPAGRSSRRETCMRAEGLEPPWLAPPAPKAGVSTDSTTPASVARLAAGDCMLAAMAEGDLVIEHPNRDRPESQADAGARRRAAAHQRRPARDRHGRRLGEDPGREAGPGRLRPHLPRARVLHRALAQRPAARRGVVRDHPADLLRRSAARSGSRATRPASTTRCSTRASLGVLTLLARAAAAAAHRLRRARLLAEVERRGRAQQPAARSRTSAQPG